jgi:hypothetical protein
VPLPAKGPTGKTQAKAIIGVSLKMYFGHERTLDWCRDVAGIAADHPGEVGGKIIAEVGGRFAEVGHAERRRIFGEDDDVFGRKTAAAYRNGLTPVLCVGESGHGLIGELAPAVAGLFLGRFAHDPEALRTILDETAERLRLLTGTETTA